MDEDETDSADVSSFFAGSNKKRGKVAKMVKFLKVFMYTILLFFGYKDRREKGVTKKQSCQKG